MKRSIKKILEQSKTIAVIGCSEKENRPSCQVAGYLKKQGYHVIPVHPYYDEVLGEKVYSSVTDIPDNIIIDVVNIFRRSEFTSDMVDQVIRREEITGQTPVVWTQLKVSSKEAKYQAREAGLEYVENKCIMVEHQKYFT